MPIMLAELDPRVLFVHQLQQETGLVVLVNFLLAPGRRTETTTPIRQTA